MARPSCKNPPDPHRYIKKAFGKRGWVDSAGGYRIPLPNDETLIFRPMKIPSVIEVALESAKGRKRYIGTLGLPIIE